MHSSTTPPRDDLPVLVDEDGQLIEDGHGDLGSTADRPAPAGELVEIDPVARLARHARLCRVCNHADREMIEDRYASWASLSRIEAEYGVPAASLSRHATATGLDYRRAHGYAVGLGALAVEIIGRLDLSTVTIRDLLAVVDRLERATLMASKLGAAGPAGQLTETYEAKLTRTLGHGR